MLSVLFVFSDLLILKIFFFFGKSILPMIIKPLNQYKQLDTSALLFCQHWFYCSINYFIIIHH